MCVYDVHSFVYYQLSTSSNDYQLIISNNIACVCSKIMCHSNPNVWLDHLLYSDYTKYYTASLGSAKCLNQTTVKSNKRAPPTISQWSFGIITRDNGIPIGIVIIVHVQFKPKLEWCTENGDKNNRTVLTIQKKRRHYLIAGRYATSMGQAASMCRYPKCRYKKSKPGAKNWFADSKLL